MPNLPPLPIVDSCLFFDHSGFIEPYMTCSRKAEYAFVWKRILSGDRPALNFGSAFHLGMELRYLRCGSFTPDASYANDVAHLLEHYFEEHPVPEGEFRNLNWAIELNRRYNDKFSIEAFSLHDYDKPITCPYCDGDTSLACMWCQSTGERKTMVEVPFAVPFGTVTIDGKPVTLIYIGKIDLPFTLDSELWLCDFKTSSVLGKATWDQYRRSSQFRGYGWAFRTLTGKAPVGFMVRCVRTKEPPLYVTEGKTSTKGKSQSPAQWWDESLQELYCRFYDGELDEWHSNTSALIDRFLWEYSRGYLPMATTAGTCTLYGKCPYYDVCIMEPADRGLYIATPQYTDNVWTPLQRPI